MKPDLTPQKWYEVDRSQEVVFVLLAIAAILGVWAFVLWIS